MKPIKEWGLLPKVLIAIALGILCSLFFPGWLARCFITFNSIFSNFLSQTVRDPDFSPFVSVFQHLVIDS